MCLQFWVWVTKDSNTEMSAAIIGAVVGGMIGILANLVSWILGGLRDKRKTRKRNRYLLGALIVELQLTDAAIKEIAGDVITSQGATAKRMNHDFLEASRFSLAEFGDDNFLFDLTKTYGNVVHTNALLASLQRGEQVRPITEVSIHVTQKTITDLTTKAEKKRDAL
jgi:hypothetical protein